MKKMLSLFCAAALLAPLSGMVVFAEEHGGIDYESRDGNVCYTMYKDRTVVFAPANEEYRWCSIPDMVMYLEPDQFTGDLQTEYIEELLYQDWNSGTNLIIEDGIDEIGDFAFHHMNIEQAQFSDDVISVGTGAFMQGRMTFLDETMYPQNVEYIPERGFYECKNLTTAQIPAQITKIGTKAFQNCTALETVTFPDGLLWINERAFEGCTALKSVELPYSVTQIGNYAFRNCTTLEKLVILNPDTEFSAYNCLGETKPTSLTIYGYTGSTAETYAETEGIPFVALEEPQTGDVNLNGQIGVTDAVMLQKYLLGLHSLTQRNSKLADLTSDGIVDAFDLAVLKHKCLNT